MPPVQDAERKLKELHPAGPAFVSVDPLCKTGSFDFFGGPDSSGTFFISSRFRGRPARPETFTFEGDAQVFRETATAGCLGFPQQCHCKWRIPLSVHVLVHSVSADCSAEEIWICASDRGWGYAEEAGSEMSIGRGDTFAFRVFSPVSSGSTGAERCRTRCMTCESMDSNAGRRRDHSSGRHA